ncbi:MAG TPA: hypothetical protein PKD10_14355 [Paracoccaceae bacterium]|nr:hypothetical protein [Paracoccaceae bacterium]HMO72745.1 hypothetical protein [Paracoccaceae bacterium]
MTLSLSALTARLRPAKGETPAVAMPGLAAIVARLRGTAAKADDDGPAVRRLAAMAAAERAREGRGPSRRLMHGLA